MSKSSKIVRSWDCSESCRYEVHAQQLFTAVSIRAQTDQQVACYLIKTCRNFAKISDGKGKTVLHFAAAFGRKDLCIWLIKKAESNVNAVDHESGYTPLHAALFYGHINVAVTLIQLGAKLSLLDREHLSPISLLSLDLASIIVLSPTRTEAYVCGSNLNYTLGIGTDDSKKFPEVLEYFRRNSLSIKQVCMEEFHTVFVTSCHQVFVCGHGQGGRLGIGKEKPLLIPTLLPTRGESCIQAAIGLNHTLLLLANGGVLSCGSNVHHQLGISPYVEHSPTPRYVNTNATRAFGKILAISASRYHSVFSTKKAIFACGLNAGQLGSRENRMDFFTVPQQITVITRETDYISLVTASVGSVSYVTSIGDIFVFHQFQHKKIIRCPGIIKLETQGGKLAPVVNGIESNEDLKLAWLTNKGSVYTWQEKRGLSVVSVGAGRILSICDISLREDNLSLVTKYGEAFTGLMKFKETGSSTEKITKISEQKIPCWCSVNIKQIPNIYRGLSITSDPKGKNVAVIQAHPANPVGFSFTSSRASTLTSQFSNFLDQASEFDGLQDIVFMVKGATIAAHKFILLSRGWSPNILKQSRVQVPSNIPLIIFKELLRFVYCGESVLLCAGKCDPTFLESGDPIRILSEAAIFAGLEDLVKILHNLRLEDGIIHCINEEKIGTLKVRFDRSDCPSLCDVTLVCDDSIELKAHKCILAARMEYFNNMFTRGWTESTAGRKIHLQFSSKIVGWMIDFLYTDQLPVSFSCDDLDPIVKLLIASDQYLIDDLKDECAIYLSEMLSLKNCTMILQLANTYNKYSLKMSVMEYIAYNLNAVIENRYLELLDESLLTELDAFCRNLFANRYKDRNNATMFYGEPEIMEDILIASYEYCGTETPADFPAIVDDEDKQKINPGKKRTPKKPIAASPPNVLNASVESDDPHLSLSVDSTQTLSPPSSSFESSFKLQEFPLLSDSFHAKTATSPPKHSFEPRRVYPPKLSQKQRKKLSTEFEEKLSLSQGDSKPKQARGWAKIEPLPETPLELSRSPVSSNVISEKPRGVPNMVDIIAVEQQKRDNLRKMTTKPLHLTQMEEAAMQALQEFYNADNCCDERITVVRVVPLNVAEPTWMPLSRRLPVL